MATEVPSRTMNTHSIPQGAAIVMEIPIAGRRRLRPSASRTDVIRCGSMWIVGRSGRVRASVSSRANGDPLAGYTLSERHRDFQYTFDEHSLDLPLVCLFKKGDAAVVAAAAFPHDVFPLLGFVLVTPFGLDDQCTAVDVYSDVFSVEPR